MPTPAPVYVATGRSRTLHAEGSIYAFGDANASVSLFGLGVSLSSVLSMSDVFVGDVQLVKQVNAVANGIRNSDGAYPIAVASNSNTVTSIVSGLSPPLTPGSFSLSIDVEEVYELVGDISNLSTQFVNGDDSEPGMPYTAWVQLERPKVGGGFSASISFQGASASVSGIVNSGMAGYNMSSPIVVRNTPAVSVDDSWVIAGRWLSAYAATKIGRAGVSFTAMGWAPGCSDTRSIASSGTYTSAQWRDYTPPPFHHDPTNTTVSWSDTWSFASGIDITNSLPYVLPNDDYSYDFYDPPPYHTTGPFRTYGRTFDSFPVGEKRIQLDQALQVKGAFTGRISRFTATGVAEEVWLRDGNFNKVLPSLGVIGPSLNIPFNLNAIFTHYGPYSLDGVGRTVWDNNGIHVDPYVTGLILGDGGSQPSTVPLHPMPATAPCVSLSMAATRVLEPFSTATGWSSGAMSGGYLEVAPAAGGTTAKTYSPDVITRANRYLQIVLRSVGSANQPVDVIIGWTPSGMSKTYRVTTGADGVFVTRWIDLCQPTNPATNTDATDTALQDLTTHSTTPHGNGGAAQTGPGWGIDRFNTLTLSFPVAGTYDFDELRAAVKEGGGKAKAATESNASASGGGNFWYRGVSIDFEGKRSLEHFGREAIADVTLTAYATPTDFVSWVNSKFTGWTATDHTTVGGGTVLIPWAHYLGGGGAIYTGSGEPDWWLDRTFAGSTLDIPAQFVVPAVVSGPFCGNCAAGGAMAGDVVIPALKIRGGGFTGLVGSNTQQPMSGVTVSADSSGGSVPSGSGVTAANGTYSTGAPYSPAGVSNRVRALAPPTPTLAAVVALDRANHRAVFLGCTHPTGGDVHMFFRPTGEVYALLATDAGLTLRRFWLDGSSDQLLTSDVAQSCSGTWQPGSGMLAAYVKSGDNVVNLIVSGGDESAFAAPIGVATGTRVAVAADPMSGVVLMAYYDGAAWQTQRARDPLGTWTAGGTVATATSGPASLEFELGDLRRARMVWVDSGTIYTSTSSDLGGTWSTPVAVISGTEVALAVSQLDGAMVLTYYDGAAWQSAVANARGESWAAAGTINTAVDGPGGLEFERGPLRRLRSVYIDGGNIYSYVSPDRGASWSAA